MQHIAERIFYLNENKLLRDLCHTWEFEPYIRYYYIRPVALQRRITYNAIEWYIHYTNL